MSFGVSIGDIITVISLAKDTVQHCRHAPSDFAEASRVSQSLYLILQGVKTEYQNLESPLHKDDRTRTDFAIHFKNCERSLKLLAELIIKHKRLATSSVRIIDRARFPKKDFLEHRGNLTFYTARLSEFLQMVGLGSLGRIEQKMEDIKGELPIVMSKLDQMCAEFRIMGDRESFLSDHTDDEKFVWKTFRSKLNQAGFTSNVLREHEAAIFLRIRELAQCGLLDTEGSSSLWPSDETLSPPLTVQQKAFRPHAKKNYAESDADSEKTISPKPSVKDLVSGESSDFDRESLPEKADFNPLQQRSNSQENIVPRTSSPLVHDDDGSDNVSHTDIKSFLAKSRVWRNVKGDIILKGILSTEFSRSGQSFVAILDSSKQEVLIPQSNLSEVDLLYVNHFIRNAAGGNEEARVHKEESLPKHPTAPKKASDVDDSMDQPIDVPRRTRPSILVGKRTRTQIRWAFRKEGSELPQAAPHRSRRSLINDLLPKAASKGDLGRVKKLLASGEDIESKGPQYWTEVTKGPLNGAQTTSTIWGTGPETTALYRAAYAGCFEIVHFLIGQGADVNTTNGENGRQGDPILFSVIRHGHEKLARLLLEYGAKSTFDGTTALHIACSYPKRDLVRLVLDYGAYIDAKDPLDQTPLYLASVGGFTNIVELLLEEGARPNVIISGRHTALYKSCNIDIIELLLRYGADPDLGHGRLGETKIYSAAWYNQLELVELLLNFGADVNMENKKKMESYMGGGEEVIHGTRSDLFEERAVANPWGKRALHAAAYQGHEAMVQMLLSAGADLEAAGNDGATPLYLAAQQKHKGVVQILLKAGAHYDPILGSLDEHKKKRRRRSKELSRDGGLERGMGTFFLFAGLLASLGHLQGR